MEGEGRSGVCPNTGGERKECEWVCVDISYVCVCVYGGGESVCF